ncbi:hypothetical protein HDU98_004598 [Podochytrium sp. JEL0797]|nr:hypothetical protein HDU98_004598 [Podochytrium sp. JEL0797]
MDSYPLSYVVHHTSLLGFTFLCGESRGREEELLEAALVAQNAASPWDEHFSKRRGFFHASTPSLSPRIATSPLFPDGLMTPLWLQKHREKSPSAVVAFARLNANAQNDDELCQSANKAKALLQTKQNQPKFALVLILHQDPKGNQQLEDRIQAIRRKCQLDSKNSLFVFPPLTNQKNEVEDFVHSLQKHLYENAVNYYREHGRRIRKKKSRIPPFGSRPPVATPVVPNLIDIDDGAPPAQPLSPMGWSVRYDYKMAVFAEFRQDLDSALRHYEEAYQTLIDMFHLSLGVGGIGGGNGTPESLVPYTKRWTEAKIFADSISIKICKLALYSDTPLPALQQHQKHLNNFKCLPEFAGEQSGSAAALTIPGLRNYAAVVPGNGSFEYWAWVSKQLRVFGELIELATKIGLKLPYPPPYPNTPSTAAASSTPQTILTNLSASSTNLLDPSPSSTTTTASTTPTSVVQHAGFYYYLSALCSQERYTRFQTTLALPPPLDTTSSRAVSKRSTLAAEQTLDHATLTIDLLTKSYEQFKRVKSGRMTLFLAAEIARAYQDAGRRDMALKFFERIARTYRKERWGGVLAAVVGWMKECAMEGGEWGVGVECLVELVSEEVTGGEKERVQVWEELMRVLSVGRGVGGGERALAVVEMDKVTSFLNCNVQWRHATGYVREPVQFQVSLGGQGPPVPVAVSRVRVVFSNGRWDTLWIHNGDDMKESERDLKHLSFVDCSVTVRDVDPDAASGDTPTSSGGKDRRVNICRTGDLTLLPGGKMVIEGQVVPVEGEEVQIVGVMVYIAKEAGTVCLSYKIGERSTTGVEKGVRRKWVSLQDGKPRVSILEGYGELSTVRVVQRQPKFNVRLVHTSPVLLDETVRMVLELSNDESQDLEGTLNLDFKNSSAGETLDKTSQIATAQSGFPPLHSSEPTLSIPASRLHDLPFHIAPHSTTTLEFHARALHTAADRTLHAHVSFHKIHPEGFVDLDDSAAEEEDARESGNSLGPHRRGGAYSFEKEETFKVACIQALECAFLWQPRAVSVLGSSNRSVQDAWKLESGMLGVMNLSLGGPVCRWGWTVVGAMKVCGVCDVVVKRVRFVSSASSATTTEVKCVWEDAREGEVDWKHGDTRNYVLHVTAFVDALSPTPDTSIGGLVVDWARKGDTTPHWTQSTLPIPTSPLTYPTLWTLVHLPATPPRVGTPFSLAYKIQNAGVNVVEVSVVVEPGEAFVFGGVKGLQRVVLVPYAEKVVRVVVVPVAVGVGRVPRVKVTRRVVDLEGGKEGEEEVGWVEEVVPMYVAGGGCVEEVVVYVWPAEVGK